LTLPLASRDPQWLHGRAFWTEERTAYLLTYAQLHSAARLAQDLGCTRNAVIGKARRLGTVLGKPDGRSIEQRREQRLAYQRERYYRLRAMQNFVVRQRKPKLLPTGVQAPKNLALFELRGCVCHWPVTPDRPFLFCGHETQPGKSYCPGHAKLALDPDQRRRH
jgi:GcrA cell cycle regulator